MDIKYVNPFIQGALEVLRSEVGGDIHRGAVQLEINTMSTQDIAVLISLFGDVEGVALFGMKQQTGLAIISKMMGSPCEALDDLALSGIAELGNVITGIASRKLSENGYICNISPPTLISGINSTVSAMENPHISIPILTAIGEIKIDLSLKD